MSYERQILVRGRNVLVEHQNNLIGALKENEKFRLFVEGMRGKHQDYVIDCWVRSQKNERKTLKKEINRVYAKIKVANKLIREAE